MTTPLSPPAEASATVAEVDAGAVAAGSGPPSLRAVPVAGTLFLFPGGSGDPTELRALEAALAGSVRVQTLVPEYGQDAAPSIEGTAERALHVIREHQRNGPYLLGGYSFGGLIALEVAQRLTAVGERVEHLFMIDAVYGESYWPRRVWLGALARRTWWHLSAISGMGPTAAARELGLRSRRLAGRLGARRATYRTIRPASDVDPRTAQALRARAEYRPRHYAGTMTVIAPSRDDHSGCDAARVWEGYADRIVVERVEGDHLSMMQSEGGPSAVARVIDRHLASASVDGAGIAPVRGFERPLILTTMRWGSAARLADALVQAGYAVSSCRPRGHPMDAVDGLTAAYHLNRLWRRRSLVAAIRKAQPDIILPDDERSLSLLRRLHAAMATEDPELAALIAHSLGRDWSTIGSRAAFATDARSMGVDAPETVRITDLDELEAWVAGRTYPLVLKSDGSWGGRGVTIVRTRAQLPRAWRRISGPPSLPRALKRLFVNLEAGYLFSWIRRARSVVNAQEFVDGREATATAACLDGSVRSLTCFDVLRVTEARGPAAVVQVVDHPQIEDTVRRLVDRYHLSGFCGFDFIINERGEAWLLEVNSRVIPTAHLLIDGQCEPGQVVALYPSGSPRTGRPADIDA